MANCLAKFTVNGDTPRMAMAGLVDEQLAYVSEVMRPKRGRPKAHEMRAFIRDCKKRGLSLEQGLSHEDMALQWWEEHPDEYPRDTDEAALRKITFRMEKLINSA